MTNLELTATNVDALQRYAGGESACLIASNNWKHATKSLVGRCPTRRWCTTENFRKVAKEHRDLEPVVEKFREYRKIRDGIGEAKAMLADTDPEVKAMAAEELARWSRSWGRWRRS